MKKRTKKIDEILKAIPSMPGEVKSVAKCDDCGHMFGHRYVPYGLGRGYLYNPCMCQITAHRPFTTLYTSRRSPRRKK